MEKTPKDLRDLLLVTDLINGLVEILWLEAEGLRDTARQVLKLVKPWDEG